MIVCDIDGTLILTSYNNGVYTLLSSNSTLIDKLNKKYDEGEMIVLYTGRHWNHLENTLKHLKICGIKYHALVLGKPPADIVIDDKAVRPDEFLA